MPGTLHIRNIDEDVIRRLSLRAARHGRSIEDEHREILRQALSNEETSSFEKLAAELRRRTAGRKVTPSEVIIREMRKER